MPRHAPELECSVEDKASLIAITKSRIEEARAVEAVRDGARGGRVLGEQECAHFRVGHPARQLVGRRPAAIRSAVEPFPADRSQRGQRLPAETGARLTEP